MKVILQAHKFHFITEIQYLEVVVVVKYETNTYSLVTYMTLLLSYDICVTKHGM